MKHLNFLLILFQCVCSMSFGQINPNAQLNTFQNLIPFQFQSQNFISRQNALVPKLIAYTNHYYENVWGNAIDSNYYVYNLFGDKTEWIHYYQSTGDWEIAEHYLYTYDNHHNLISETIEWWDADHYVPTQRYIWKYNEAGLPIQRTTEQFVDSSGTFRLSYMYSYLYDELNRLISSTHFSLHDNGWDTLSQQINVYANDEMKPATIISRELESGVLLTTSLQKFTYTDFDSIATQTTYSTYDFTTHATDTVLNYSYTFSYDDEHRFNKIEMYSASEEYCGYPDDSCLIATSVLTYYTDSIIEIFSAKDPGYELIYERTFNTYYLNQYDLIYLWIGQVKFAPSDEWQLYLRYNYYYKEFNSDIESIESILVYPNPFSDIINFEFPAIIGATAHLTIYDILGNKIYDTTLNDQISSWQPTTGLASGIYFYQIEVNDQIFTGKLIHQ